MIILGISKLDRGPNLPHVEIVPSTTEHVRELAEHLRTADRAELDRVYGFPPHKALWRCYKGSFMRYTAFVDGEIAAMWGVGGTPMGNVGSPWLMTSDAVHNVSPLFFTRTYQQEVLRMLKAFPILINYVDAEYTAAIRLLDIIGFEIGAPETKGSGGAVFRKFEMRM